MTQSETTIMLMPNFLGEPLYPGGFPVPAINIFFEGVSVEQLKLKYYQQTASEEELEILKNYVLYFIGAPVFHLPFDNKEQEEEFKKMSLDDMLDLLLDAGIDPL